MRRVKKWKNKKVYTYNIGFCVSYKFKLANLHKYYKSWELSIQIVKNVLEFRQFMYGEIFNRKLKRKSWQTVVCDDGIFII